MISIIKRNSYIYWATQLSHSLVFTIPIWIVYYQGFLNPVEISTIMAFQYLLQMLLELPSGALADMLGRRFSLMLAFFIGGISYLIFPFARDFWHFMFLAALVGISDSFRSGSEEALIYDTFKQENDEEQFEKVTSRAHLVYQAGLIIGTLTGGFMASVNVFFPFVAYGVSMLIGFVLTLFYIEPKIDSEKFSLRSYLNQIKQGTKEAFRDKLTTYTSLYYIFVGGITWTNALYFGSFYAIWLGFNELERGFIQSGVRLINILAITYILSKLKLSDRVKIIFFPIIMLIGFLPGAFVTGWAGVPFFELAMLAGTARWIFLTPMTNRAFSSKVRATAISVLSLLIGFVYIAIVGISGSIITTYGMGVMYTGLGVITLFTTVPLGYLLHKQQSDRIMT